VGNGRGHVQAELAVLFDHRPSCLAERDDALVVVEIVRDDEPRRAAWLVRDRLGQVTLVPGRRAGEELLAGFVHHASFPVPELREPHVILLADPSGRRGHGAAVELVEVARGSRSSSACEIQSVAVAPRVAAHQQPVLARVPDGEPSGGKHHRLFRPCPGDSPRALSDSDIPGRPDERFGQAARVETLSGGARVGRVLRDDRWPERDKPVERLVEAVEDRTLELLVAAGALGTEVLERAVPPDDAAREEHRAARPRAFLQHDRLRAELTGPRSSTEAGHPGSRNYH
jgi:hypothetical protein